MSETEKEISWKNRYLNCIKQPQLQSCLRTVCEKLDVPTGLYVLGIAPAIIAFVNFVLEDARKRGKNRLYFLSRDGFQMYLVAKRMVEMRKLSMECKYLRVSRYAMRMPGYCLNPEACVDSICVGGIDVTVEKILKRCGLSQTEVADVMEEVGLTEECEKILNYRQVQSLKPRLRESKLLKDYVALHSGECYQNAISYLRQEGLLKDDRYALVDSGWIGTLQCSIETLLQSEKPGLSIEGYYFGMYEIPKGEAREKFHTFYFGPKWGLRRKARFSNSLFETIVSAEEGMTAGYEAVAEWTLPILLPITNPNSEQLKKNIIALQKVLDYIELNQMQVQISTEEIENLLYQFMSSPTELEVESYGNMLFSDDVLDGSFKKVAAELSYEDIKAHWFMNRLFIIAGIRKKEIHESAWIEGSAVRCGKKVKNTLNHIRAYKWFLFGRKQINS